MIPGNPEKKLIQTHYNIQEMIWKKTKKPIDLFDTIFKRKSYKANEYYPRKWLWQNERYATSYQ